jgi:pyruvate,water dikinase
VLVCEVTTPNYVPLMQKAVAIVTDQGGILSHAAIVARELKKPCIVGTGNATKILKTGQIVSVDANNGAVFL